jgi:hypothetical protein
VSKKKPPCAVSPENGNAILPPVGPPVLILGAGGRPVLKPDPEWQAQDALTPDEEVSKAAARRAWTASVYHSPGWLLGHILGWIAFRDPKLICRFEGPKSRQRMALYGMRSTGRKRRLMAVAGPDHVLLAALQRGELQAMRNGEEIPRHHWSNKTVQDLADDLCFWQAEVLRCWPAESDRVEAVLQRPDQSAPEGDETVVTSPAGNRSGTEPAAYRTGLAGRPTSWSLVDEECRRRWRKGERHPGRRSRAESPAEWANTLSDWLQFKHPKAPKLQLKTLTNKLSSLLRVLSANRQN